MGHTASYTNVQTLRAYIYFGKAGEVILCYCTLLPLYNLRFTGLVILPSILIHSSRLLSSGISSEEKICKDQEDSDNSLESIYDISDKNYFLKFVSHDKDVTIKFKNGNTYEGRMSHFMMERKGIYTWKDGTQFQGNFVHGIAQGTGYFSWPSKGWYFGDIKDNRRHGKGICVVWEDNKELCYYGRWKNGQRDGKVKCGSLYILEGIMMFGKNNWYDGQWKHDKMHGLGLRVYPSGSYYNGHWKYGLAQGFGKMQWSNGDTYSGKWKNGKMHGKGTYVWKNIQLMEFALPLLNVHEGSYKNGKKNGFGKLLLSTGAMVSTFWRDDRKEGPGQIVCRNGLIIESSCLFFDDRIFDTGTPFKIPSWNQWYYNFLSSYQDGMVSSPNIEEKPVQDITDSGSINKKERKAKDQHIPGLRKQCFNNIPIAAAVDSLPLWEFIEMASSLTPSQPNQENNITPEQLTAAMIYEEERLRKVIAKRMPDLNYLYQHYAKLAFEEHTDTKCFLLRLLLWQMCIDCNIDRTTLTLASLDRKAGIGTYPFDVIPMFEMVYYLLHIAFELCMRTKLINKKIPGLCGSAFDYFLTNIAVPATKKGNILVSLCNWLPLNELYDYYISFTTPVTVMKILSRYYWSYMPYAPYEGEDGEDEMTKGTSYLSVHLPLIPGGKNLIDFDGKIIFKSNANMSINEEYGIYAIDAQALMMSIGEEVVMDFILKACPRAAKILVKHFDYEVSFLEFCIFIFKLINEYGVLYLHEKVVEEETIQDTMKDITKLQENSNNTGRKTINSTNNQINKDGIHSYQRKQLDASRKIKYESGWALQGGDSVSESEIAEKKIPTSFSNQDLEPSQDLVTKDGTTDVSMRFSTTYKNCTPQSDRTEINSVEILSSMQTVPSRGRHFFEDNIERNFNSSIFKHSKHCPLDEVYSEDLDRVSNSVKDRGEKNIGISSYKSTESFTENSKVVTRKNPSSDFKIKNNGEKNCNSIRKFSSAGSVKIRGSPKVSKQIPNKYFQASSIFKEKSKSFTQTPQIKNVQNDDQLKIFEYYKMPINLKSNDKKSGVIGPIKTTPHSTDMKLNMDELDKFDGNANIPIIKHTNYNDCSRSIPPPNKLQENISLKYPQNILLQECTKDRHIPNSSKTDNTGNSSDITHLSSFISEDLPRKKSIATSGIYSDKVKRPGSIKDGLTSSYAQSSLSPGIKAFFSSSSIEMCQLGLQNTKKKCQPKPNVTFKR